MTRSGSIKRGLAVSAIAALAVTGLPASALADSVNDQVGAGTVELFSQYSGFASVQNDGVNQTVHLVAGGGDDVAQVRFEYGPVGTPTVITTVARTNGVFSAEWAPPAAIYGTTVDIRAVGLTSVGTPVAGGAGTDTASVQVGANRAALDIANAPGSDLGIFDQPYGIEAEEAGLPGDGVDHSTSQGIVTGTTSSADTIELVDLSAGTPRTPLGPITPGDADANGIRPFRGTVNFANYALDTTAPIENEALIGGNHTANGSDDVEVVNLEAQTIATVTAENVSVPNGTTGTAVITVTDAEGRPVAGAQVIGDLNRNGVWDGGASGGTEQSRYTDANGQARFANLPGSAAGTAYDFFVNTDGGDDYQADRDFLRTVTVTTFAQNVTNLAAESNDGAAFDTQEYTAGDITVQVNDQNGDPINNQTVSYTWTFQGVPAAGAPTPAPVTTTGTAGTNADGEATIGAPSNGFAGNGTYTLNAYVNNNGTPGQQDGEPAAAPLVLKAGDSTLEISEDPEVAISGTTETFSASLELFDGTPLTGRNIAFAYTATGNSVVAAQANQPAGTTRTSDTGATGTTDAAGVARVAISDPAAPDAAELGNTLNAQTANTPDIGNAAESATARTIDFVDGTPPARSTVTLAPIADGKPGVATSGTVTVTEDADNDPTTPATAVVGQAVTLTVDGDAYFTDGVVQPGATGEDQELDNDGQTITVVTGAGGVASFQTSIGRSEDFDDDGEATVTVTATAGSFSDTEEQDFSSADPINGGEVILELSPEGEQDNPVEPTRTGDVVFYDVYVTDGFGNRVGGETVDLEVDGDAEINATGAADDDATSDFAADGDFYVTDDTAETVEVTAEWTTSTLRYNNATPPVVVGGTETLEDTADVEFYDIDFAASTFRIDTSANGTVPVGTTVTTVVTVVDQEGNPVEGLEVAFIRSGPGNQQDGDPNDVIETNENGQAFYVFSGTAQGTATISAVVTEQGDSAPLETLSTTVAFGPDDDDEPEPIRVTVTGGNRGANDRVVVRTSPAASNAVVQLFRRGNGGLVRVAVKRATKAGFTAFVVRDRNGNRVTRYIAKVGPTADTRRGRGFGNVR